MQYPTTKTPTFALIPLAAKTSGLSELFFLGNGSKTIQSGSRIRKSDNADGARPRDGTPFQLPGEKPCIHVAEEAMQSTIAKPQATCLTKCQAPVIHFTIPATAKYLSPKRWRRWTDTSTYLSVMISLVSPGFHGASRISKNSIIIIIIRKMPKPLNHSNNSIDALRCPMSQGPGFERIATSRMARFRLWLSARESLTNWRIAGVTIEASWTRLWALMVI